MINFRLKRTSAKTIQPPEAKSGGRSNNKNSSSSSSSSSSKGDASKSKVGSSKRKPTPAAAGPPSESVTARNPVEGGAKKGQARMGLSEELRSVQQDLQFSNMVLPPPVTQAAPSASASASASASGGNKTQRLQRLLAETEKKRKRLQVRSPPPHTRQAVTQLDLFFAGAEQGRDPAGHQAAQEHSLERRHQSSGWYHVHHLMHVYVVCMYVCIRVCMCCAKARSPW